MQMLYYELGVLSRSVHFKNLSAAALHVGLSQPQLSRIIARLEDELKVVLLDRSAKRKSGWTPVAFQLAEIFEKANRRLESDILGASHNEITGELHIGSLEGLSGLALKTTHACFTKIGIKKIALDVMDLTELEANYLSGSLDLIFTSKVPGRQKGRYVEELGHQDWTNVRSSKAFAVYSTFEHNRAARRETGGFEHVLVSNSLAIKKEWFDLFGGTGTLPSEPRKGRVADGEPVLLVGSELLSPVLWQRVCSIIELEEK